MVEFSNINTADNVPKVGDVLVIQTKKSGSKKIMCRVKGVVGLGSDVEVILQKSTNSFFNWEMYKSGESWVSRVWNLGDIYLTTASNSMQKFVDF